MMEASQSWSDVSAGFWGTSFDFNGTHFGGPEIYAAAAAQHDRWVDIDRAGGDYGDNDYPVSVSFTCAGVGATAGPWPPSTHDEIIAAAFPGLPEFLLSIIQEGSRLVDFNVLPETFDPRLAYRHGMVPGPWVEQYGLTRATEMAREAAIIYRTGLLSQSRNDFAQGLIRPSLLKFGKAMHPLMDIQSPAHQWKVYSVHPIAGVEVVRQLHHAWKESGAPTKAQMKVMTNTLRYHLSRTVSREFYQSALSPSIGPRTR